MIARVPGALLFAALLAAPAGCATPPAVEVQPVRYRFFEPVPGKDPWGPNVRLWQASRYLEQLRGPEEGGGASALGAELRRFQQDLRRGLVEDLVAWVQLQSGLYFRSDEGEDYWPTLGEVTARGFDDCDGLDLLTFETLRAVGFGPGEVYRAILQHGDSGRYHMVTLWFEEGKDADPWVLDPTGEMTRPPARLSELRAWRPLRIFDESSQFQVAPAPEVAAPAR